MKLMLIRPPSGVNLMALATMLVKTCSSWASSAWTLTSSCESAPVMVTFRESASGRSAATTMRRTWPSSTCLRFRFPEVSCWETVSMSSISLRRRSEFREMTSIMDSMPWGTGPPAPSRIMSR